MTLYEVKSPSGAVIGNRWTAAEFNAFCELTSESQLVHSLHPVEFSVRTLIRPDPPSPPRWTKDELDSMDALYTRLAGELRKR